MKIKIMYPNQMGRLEFTKEQLEELLKEAYDEGYRDGKNNGSYTINSSKVSTLDSTDYWYRYPQVTCTVDSALSGKASYCTADSVTGTVSSYTTEGISGYGVNEVSAAKVADLNKVDINDIS